MAILKAIILKSIPYSETQRILHVFAAEKGYTSLITPESWFKRKSNTSFQCMQIVEIEYIQNKRERLHKVKTITLDKNTTAIYFDIYKMNIALLWGEILYLVLRNEERNEPLFEYLENSIEYLNSSQNDIANFNLFFLFRLCGLLGFSIDTSTFRPGYVFNINDGHFYPQGYNDTYLTGPHSARIIQQFCTCPLKKVGNIPLNRQSRSILLDILFLFLGFHLNIDFNIKSIKVIREIFS